MRTVSLGAILALVLFPCLAYAGTVPIVNASFEDPQAATFPATLAVGNTGSYAGGWFRDDVSGGSVRSQFINGSASPWTPMTNQLGNMALFCAQNNILYRDPDTGNLLRGMLGGTAYQTVYLEAGNTYTLTVGVGTNAGGTAKNPYARFGLAFASAPAVATAPVLDPGGAGNVGVRPPVLAEIEGYIPDRQGILTDYSVSYAPPTSGYYNIALQNRGFKDPLPAIEQSTVWFDNVRLTYVPEPSTAMLVILGGAGLLLRRRHA